MQWLHQLHWILLPKIHLEPLETFGFTNALMYIPKHQTTDLTPQQVF